MEEYTLDDYINLLALKNQLINAKLSTLMKDYKEDYLLYLQFLESVYMLLETDSGFLLFSQEAKDKIYSIIDIHRFDDDKEIYMSDSLYKDACALVIIQIGEFIGRLSDEFRYNHKEINWQEIIGMRNIFAHNYEDVIDDIVWDVIQEDIPNLKIYLENLLNE